MLELCLQCCTRFHTKIEQLISTNVLWCLPWVSASANVFECVCVCAEPKLSFKTSMIRCAVCNVLFLDSKSSNVGPKKIHPKHAHKHISLICMKMPHKIIYYFELFERFIICKWCIYLYTYMWMISIFLWLLCVCENCTFIPNVSVKHNMHIAVDNFHHSIQLRPTPFKRTILPNLYLYWICLYRVHGAATNVIQRNLIEIVEWKHNTNSNN